MRIDLRIDGRIEANGPCDDSLDDGWIKIEIRLGSMDAAAIVETRIDDAPSAERAIDTAAHGLASAIRKRIRDEVRAVREHAERAGNIVKQVIR